MRSFAALALLATALIGAPVASAQGTGGSDVVCTYAFWEFNSNDESPCFVWGQLQSLCIPAGLTVSPLINASYQYSPPSVSGQINDCNCNVVSYNLMAACAWCQPNIYQSNWVTEAQWETDCTTYNPSGITGLSSTTIADLDIPQWAYMPDGGASWDPETAEIAYNSSTSAAASSTSLAPTHSSAAFTQTSQSVPAQPTTTTSQPSTGAGGTNGNTGSSNSGSSSSSSGGSNTGAIAGGVVGGVVVLIIIAVLIWWLMRRNRRAAAANGIATGAGAGAAGGVAGASEFAPYGNEQKPPMAQYPSSVSPEIPYSQAPSSPYPPGTTPSPFPYQTSTSGTAYDGTAPPTSYAGSPPPMGYYQQPGYGEPYGQQVPVGRYTGLPEA